MIKPASPVQRKFYFCYLVFFLILTACAAPTPHKEKTIDAEFAALMSSGRAAFDRGLIEQAATLYQQALQRARTMDNAIAIGDAAYNMAACRIRLGQLEKARSLLAEARSEILSVQGDISDIQLVEAKIARMQGNSEEALSFTEQILSLPATTITNEQRLQVYLLRGQIACDRGDAALALEELQMAETFAAGATDPALPAGLSQLAGRIHLIQEEPIMAAREFDREATLLKQAGRYAQMVRALYSAAESYMRAGKYRLAADRFFRSARSAFAQGEIGEARKIGQMALAAADTAGDQPARARVQALLAEIENAAHIK